MMHTKDAESYWNELAPLAAADAPRITDVVLTPMQAAPAHPPEELARVLSAVWGRSRRSITVHTAPNVRAAIAQAEALAAPDGSIIVTGSLYLIGEVRECLGLP
jgi:folylpolyglutamate synthase/dihydropteroate synthase